MMSRRRSSRTTLNDIATQAGVSVTTVSRVLGDPSKPHRVSSEVVARIQQIASELDYSPNLLVRSMQHGRTYTITFFNGFRARGEDDLYMDKLSTAVEQACGRMGYDTLISCVFERSAEDTYRIINGGRCD